MLSQTSGTRLAAALIASSQSLSISLIFSIKPRSSTSNLRDPFYRLDLTSRENERESSCGVNEVRELIEIITAFMDIHAVILPSQVSF
jgi:hypothetical protein